MGKREGARMVGVVPVLVHMSRMFRNQMRQECVSGMPAKYRLYRIVPSRNGDTENRRAFHDMMNFVAAHRSRFELFVVPYVDNVWAQIVGGILIPFIVYDESVVPPVVVSMYIFKNSSVEHVIENEKNSCIELVASVSKDRKTNHRIYFTHTLAALRPEFGFVILEETSDIVELMGFVRSISELTEIYAQSSEYIMFNFAAHPILAGKALLIGL
jgi:hypothetical protein